MIRKNIDSHGYYIGLLIALIVVFTIPPFLDGDSVFNRILNISFLLTLLFSVLIASRSKKLIILAAILAAPVFANSLQNIFSFEIIDVSLIHPIFGIAFVSLIVYIILQDIFLSKKIDSSLIIGAIALYFLIGFLWGFIYTAIENFYPGSFLFAASDDHKNQIGALIYFSLTTLTTLGYGDIAPMSPQARSMATIQAVVGQIYLTILVARLVGMHIVQKK